MDLAKNMVGTGGAGGLMRETGLWGGDPEYLWAGEGTGLHQVLVSPTSLQAGEGGGGACPRDMGVSTIKACPV